MDALLAKRADLVLQRRELSQACRAPTRNMLQHLDRRLHAVTDTLRALDASWAAPRRTLVNRPPSPLRGQARGALPGEFRSTPPLPLSAGCGATP